MTNELNILTVDTEQILSTLVQSFQKSVGRTLYPADPEMLRLKWFADIIAQERNLINTAGLMNLLRNAAGAYLDALCDVFFDTVRLQPISAKTTIRFFLSEKKNSVQTIPQGTRVGAGDLLFATTDTLTIQPNTLYGDIKAECQTAGEIGNGLLAGTLDETQGNEGKWIIQSQISEIVDLYPFYGSCGNITVSDGGANIESDESLRERAQLSLEAYSTAGAEGAYIYRAKSVSQNIADVYPFSPEPVHLILYILMKDGKLPEQETLDDVLKAVSAKDRRPMTDFVTVSVPNIVPFEVDVSYWIPITAVKSTLQIQTAVEKAVDDYIIWQTSKMGRDIEPAELIERMKQAGAKRPRVLSPSDDVFIMPGSVAQLAHSKIVTYMGVEDE
jgi:phage-related baseplate assembly protein